MSRSQMQWFLTIAGLSGIVSVFLPFTWDVRPFKAAWLYLFVTQPGLDKDIWFFAAPFLSSAVISVSLIRWNFSGRLSLFERIILYIIGLSVMVIVLRTYFRFMADVIGNLFNSYWNLFSSNWNIFSSNFWNQYISMIMNYRDPQLLMSLILSASSFIAGIILVIRNHRQGKYKYPSPIMLMQTAYVSNGIFCLVGFWRGWQTGAYFALVTVSVYVAQMVRNIFQKKIISRQIEVAPQIPSRYSIQT
jgi:hypothetical protein